jgi:DNA-binding transcriptional regulator LsrR (DeoR family)
MTVLTQGCGEPAERGPGPAELIQMTRIARRYYLGGPSKKAIADELGLSRFQVARSLRKARDSGLVRISIYGPGDIAPNEEEHS